jgi:phage tail-like protein
MRGTVAGLHMPYPLETLLPAVLAEDHFTRRFTAGLDEVLAPVVSTLDCLEAYVNPLLAPADFLDWVSSWFSEVLDEKWLAQRRRRFVTQAVEVFRTRGTPAGLRRELELSSGGRVQVSESGGVAWSLKPEAELAGEAVPRLVVRVIVDDLATVNHAALDALIEAAKPAHVVHSLEVVDR